MRSRVLLLIASLALLPPTARGQVPTAKGASMEARRANQHYKNGWDAMHKEAWDEAAKEFQAAIDSDDAFALAYYALGRAEMSRRNFTKAIAAYLRCRELYLNAGGARFSSQLDYKRRLEDRILQYETAIREAQQGSTGKAQSQQLITRQLQTTLMTLQQARDRTDNVQIEVGVPFFVPMALGAAYFRSGQFADAEREYKTAIEANPGSGETHSNLAVLYLTTNRVDQAAREIKLAEDTGFKVNSNLKDDISKKKGGNRK
jgi:tetratricopeptide (TPR) repeat protein